MSESQEPYVAGPPENPHIDTDKPSPAQPSVERRSRSSFPLLIFILCFLFGIWIIPWIAYPISYSINRGAEKAKTEAAIAFFKEMQAQNIDLPVGSIAPWVAKKVGSSVVGIKTHGIQPTGGRASNPFGRGFQEIYGEGSGIIVDKEGYILTNFHVVAAADQVSVVLSDGREIQHVHLVGFDQATDLAVLKIEVSGLQAMDWGDSTAAEVGEQVLAIGNPFGLEHTVTQGIISAKERYQAIPNSPMALEFLQTDAAINPGNSGGALVNIRGELIGINTAILGESYQGIGFAIPSELAKKIYERILQTKQPISRGYLGIEMDSISESYAEKNKVAPGKGVVVRAVRPDSPAEKAELKTGDIILLWDNKEITMPRQLSHWVILTEPGTQVTIQIVRDGEKLEKTIVVGERPRADTTIRSSSPQQ